MTAKPRVDVEWAPVALAELRRRVGSRTMQESIIRKVDELKRHHDPAALGKPLRDELLGLYRLPFGRYRILYKVSEEARDGRVVTVVRVLVVLVGMRRDGDKSDVYRIATRLRRRGEI